jgi:hypothetical protein
LVPAKEYPIYINSDTTTVDISFMTLRSTDATNGRHVAIPNTAVDITLIIDNCIIGTPSASSFAPNQVAVQIIGSSKQHSVSVTNSTLYGHGNKAVNFLENCQNAAFDNNDIVSNSPTQNPFWVRADSDSLVVKNNDIASDKGLFTFDTGTTVSVGMVECFDNDIEVVEEALYIPGIAPAGTLYVNKVKFNRNTIVHDAASDDFTIHICEDTALNEPLELIEIIGNKITRLNGTNGEHVIFLAPNMEGAAVSDNKVTGGAFGLVIKGKWHTVTGNLIKQGSNATTSHAAYLKGAYGCLFENNTIVANSSVSGVAFVVIEQNVIRNNIFDGRLGHYAVRLVSGFLTDTWDYNNFQGGQSGFASVDGLTDPTDLATLQVMWADNATTNEGLLNDANSLEVDPQFDADCNTTNPELMDGGSPNANDDPTSIGVVGPGRAKAFFRQGG